MTPEQRRERARMGGLRTAELGHVNTAPAREAFLNGFKSEAEKHTHFVELGRRSGAARQVNAEEQAFQKRVRKAQRRREARLEYDPYQALVWAVFGAPHASVRSGLTRREFLSRLR